MNRDARDRLIEAYFDALDAESFDRLEPVLSEDFTYHHPDVTVRGPAEMKQFFEDRAPQETTHTLTRRIHAEEVSVCEGELTGELADGTPREGAFCDVFEFDDEEAQLTEVAVYARL